MNQHLIYLNKLPKKANRPTYVSAVILKARAENGSDSAGFLENFRLSLVLYQYSIPISGEGRYSQTQSNKNWTPLFLKADPQTIGIIPLS